MYLIVEELNIRQLGSFQSIDIFLDCNINF